MTRPVHELKSMPALFAALWDGAKRFDIRRADRDFRVGDGIILREWHADRGPYSGREVRGRIVYLETIEASGICVGGGSAIGFDDRFAVVLGLEIEMRCEEMPG